MFCPDTWPTDVDLRIIARGTPGFSGADLANLVNESALMAARVGRRFVTMIDFESAKDKVMMGAERRSMVMSEEEKRNTAYHEAGHALVAVSVPSSHPVHKATIIPRGRALGMVMQLPERDQISMSYEEMTSRLAVMMVYLPCLGKIDQQIALLRLLQFLNGLLLNLTYALAAYTQEVGNRLEGWPSLPPQKELNWIGWIVG